MTTENGKKLFLLDAYALVFRSYYAFIKNPRITSYGLNTSAIFGFMLTLDEILQNQNPSHIAVVFDPPGPNFRHDMFPAYKANRDETPEDIKKSVPFIKRLLEAYRIPVIEVPGFEADDVIGALTLKASRAGFTTYMMTPDKDFAQLVNDKVLMYKPARSGGAAEIWGPEEVKREFRIKDPLQVIDILALMGDSADNIPGAPGVGPKTAMKLIEEFGSVENLLGSTSKLTGRIKDIIEANREQITMSKTLATIRIDMPVDFNEKELEKETADYEAVAQLFKELEFRQLLSKITQAAEAPQKADSPVAKSDNSQGSLFPGNETFASVTDDLISLDKVPHDYRMLSETKEIKELVEKLMRSERFCFDTETTSLDPLLAELVAISFSVKKGEGFLIRFPGIKEKDEELLELVRPLFTKKGIVKVGQNLKYDIEVLGQHGIDVAGPFFDTMLAHYLLFPDARHNMDFMASKYLGYKTIPIESLIGEKGRTQGSMRNADDDKLVDYAVEDADITWQLAEIFGPMLEKEALTKVAYEVEMPLIKVLAGMEMTGIRMDETGLTEYADELRNEIIRLEQEIYEMAGFEFNISSPKQLGDVLFIRMKLSDNARLTKTKQFSTNEEVLQRLSSKHPIIDKVLEYRGLKKLLSTYVEALPQLISPVTGRIHTSFNQAVAATGRLSSNNPNMQNIPVRDERGREIRKTFVPGDGAILLSADYSQIELRLMAHLSGDASMIADFMSGSDIHAATAAKIFGISEEDVTREMRSRAKTANFGIIYGISSYGLSERLTISRHDAKELIDGYFRSYPGVKEFMDRSIEMARSEGLVRTIFGRKRELRDINSRNAVLRGNAERNAINAPIQGSAADIIKLAMIKIDEDFRQKNIRSRMILQVHDELVFEVIPDEMDEVKNIVVRGMEDVVKLSVPLKVDTGTGSNWLEAH